MTMNCCAYFTVFILRFIASSQRSPNEDFHKYGGQWVYEFNKLDLACIYQIAGNSDRYIQSSPNSPMQYVQNKNFCTFPLCYSPYTATLTANS